MANMLGLGGGYFHDASACLVRDGEVVAFAEEERFSRRKHAYDSRSCESAIDYCLAEAGLRPADVDAVAVGWNASWPTPVDSLPAQLADTLIGRSFDGAPTLPITVLDHHHAHAASAFYCSGAAEAGVLVADGSGDGVATSIWRGSGRGLELLESYPFTQSLGWFYEFATENSGLGGWSSAGKLMGLAAYGDPDRLKLPFFQVGDEGYRIDLGAHGLDPDAVPVEEYVNLDYYRRLKRAYKEAFAAVLGGVVTPDRVYDEHRAARRNATTYDPRAADLAAVVQAELERAMTALARRVRTLTGASVLALAGGVGLNCSSNGKLQRQRLFERIFVQPAAGDSGLAIGCALELAARAGDLTPGGFPMASAALGPGFSDEAIGEVLAATGLGGATVSRDAVELTARAIADGQVVGWFQGRMEAGPRALGQRSILGNPTTTGTRERINRSVKNREPWRPLAPSMLRSRAADYLTEPGGFDSFMLTAYDASERCRQELPAVVHADGTLRPQVVPDDQQSRYRDLLAILDAGHGIGAVLNTSFNHESEPIVCTPYDALRTFYSTPLDALALGDHFIRKP